MHASSEHHDVLTGFSLAGMAPSETAASPFVDRRTQPTPATVDFGSERRQFGSTHEGLTRAGRELALAIDNYKVTNHRRYITCDEMLQVLEQLGYQRLP